MYHFSQARQEWGWQIWWMKNIADEKILWMENNVYERYRDTIRNITWWYQLEISVEVVLTIISLYHFGISVRIGRDYIIWFESDSDSGMHRTGSKISILWILWLAIPLQPLESVVLRDFACCGVTQGAQLGPTHAMLTKLVCELVCKLAGLLAELVCGDGMLNWYVSCELWDVGCVCMSTRDCETVLWNCVKLWNCVVRLCCEIGWSY